MKRIVVSLLLMLIFTSLFCSVSFAEEERIFDPDKLLSKSEKNTLDSVLLDAECKTGFIFRIYLTDEELYYGEEDLIFDRFALEDTDSVILLIDKSYYGEYEYELFTYGEAYHDISDSAVDRILDAPDVYDNIKSGHLAEGLIAFANLTKDEIINGRQSAFVTVLVISIVIGLIAGGTGIAIVIYRYKHKRKAPVYPLTKYANLNLDYSSDNFLGSSVTRSRVSSSRSGGGSSGGGGSRGKR